MTRPYATTGLPGCRRGRSKPGTLPSFDYVPPCAQSQRNAKPLSVPSFWPDQVRDEVLARLLELNAERAKEEARSGAATIKKSRGKTAAKAATKTKKTDGLFD